MQNSYMFNMYKTHANLFKGNFKNKLSRFWVSGKFPIHHSWERWPGSLVLHTTTACLTLYSFIMYQINHLFQVDFLFCIISSFREKKYSAVNRSREYIFMLMSCYNIRMTHREFNGWSCVIGSIMCWLLRRLDKTHLPKENHMAGTWKT